MRFAFHSVQRNPSSNVSMVYLYGDLQLSTYHSLMPRFSPFMRKRSDETGANFWAWRSIEPYNCYSIGFGLGWIMNLITSLWVISLKYCRFCVIPINILLWLSWSFQVCWVLPKNLDWWHQTVLLAWGLGTRLHMLLPRTHSDLAHPHSVQHCSSYVLWWNHILLYENQFERQ